MKTRITFVFSFFLGLLSHAQAPVSNFSVSPNPVCSQNTVQVTDLSLNQPTAWSYTVMGGGGPGPGTGTTYTIQNPVITFNNPGTFTISLVASNGSGAGQRASLTITVLPSPQIQIVPQQANTCPGGNPTTINLFSFGMGGPYSYSWSTGAQTQSISVSPSVTTSYSAVVTATNGCTVSRSATVNVAQATVSVNAFPASICPGSSSTLTATGTQPGPFTYSWSTGATSRTISTSSAGVYTVEVINANGCSARQTYSLGSSATLSLGISSTPSVLCAGNTATLRANGAASYTWDNGSTAPIRTVNPLSSTIYTLSGMFSTCSGTASIPLTVGTTPTILATANPASVCAGNAATLSASGASSFTWAPGGTAQSLTVAPALTSTYVVSGINPGCPTRTAAVTITVHPKPVLTVSSSASLTCAGEMVAIAVSGAATYTWDGGSNSAVLLVSPLVTTVYSVTGSAANSCASAAVFTQSVSPCTGISDTPYEQAVLVFPNPSTGWFNVRNAGGGQNAVLEVFDVSGKLVLKARLSGEENVIRLPAAGLYLVKVSSDGRVLLHSRLIFTP